MKYMENITDIIQAICAVLNIILLYYFTKSEWEHSKEKEKIEKKKVWYDKIIAERIMKLLEEYFEKSENILKSNIDKQEMLLNIKECYRSYKRIIMPLIEIFSKDLRSNVFKLLEEYNDVLLKEAEKDCRQMTFMCEKTINEKKSSIYKELYSYDFGN